MFENLVTPNIASLEKSELEILDGQIASIKPLTADQTREFSHELQHADLGQCFYDSFSRD
ncbi:MAG: hypothetical protein IJS50_00580 [Desulfovibrio sp.]|nr:hypothetical protein [Desulfovibrio sp.]